MTQQEIASYVVSVVAVWSNRDKSQFTAATSLTTDLNLNSVRLRTMTGALRNFIQMERPSSTLLVREVKQAKKLGPLVALVIERRTGSANVNEGRQATLISNAISN